LLPLVGPPLLAVGVVICRSRFQTQTSGGSRSSISASSSDRRCCLLSQHHFSPSLFSYHLDLAISNFKRKFDSKISKQTHTILNDLKIKNDEKKNAQSPCRRRRKDTTTVRWGCAITLYRAEGRNIMN